ncbi:Tir chaperone protein (CesT) [Variovorax sp. PBS-H4]|uniref:CesT family type III secretion system chaperone n=1 Tax=Variovorax sp. PBS-H4 TaxID=434008 RepID=UPI001316986C|nr:CesT family type III secretion system chaperone [Variovorax sp. PBS-H4]VTU40841.1 Tir chaperone protein (CesT) [Variovorax sp. PBS-H4]
MKEADSAHPFLDLVNGFYRHAGHDAPVFEFDPRVAVAFETCVEDVQFSVGYDPLSGPTCIFAYCVFGVVPLATDAAALRRLLALNISMAQQYSATYCIDDSTQELACYLRMTLDTDAQALHAALVQIARLAQRWRRDGFEAKAQDLSSMHKAGEPPAWTAFA